MRLFEYPFVVLFVVLFLAFAWAGQLRSEDESEARTKASLALAKAARERAKVSPIASTKTDVERITDAGVIARRKGIPLVIWVGIDPLEHRDVYDAFGECIHVVVRSNNGNDKPRLLYARPDKMEVVAYSFKPNKETPKKMQAVYREVMGGPDSRVVIPQQVPYRFPVGSGPDCPTGS
jgi:hypothetical protein